MRGWRPVVFAIAVAWAVALAYSSLSGRALYADGAHFVLALLQEPFTFIDYNAQRTYASYIVQAPILLGQRLGVETTGAYAALYSTGIYALPAAMMLAALFLSRAQPLLFAANAFAIAVFGFGANFIVTETNLLFGFVWLSITILALDRPAPILRGVALPILAFALMRIYEGMLFVGPLLAVWAFIAAGRPETTERERIGVSLAGFFYLVAGFIALGTVLGLREARNATSFLTNTGEYLRSPAVFILLAAAAVFPGTCLPSRRAGVAGAVIGLAFGIAFLVALARLEGFYAYVFTYRNRALLVFALGVVVAVLLAVYRFRPAWLRSGGAQDGYILALIPFAFAIAGDWVGTHRWNAFVGAFCQVLEKNASPAERLAELKASGTMMGWGWTQPSMSVLLRDRGSTAMVINEPGQRYEPFDAANPPKLDMRGICQAPLRGEARVGALGEPISFQAGKYPPFVASVRGLSQPEGWGTWSDGPRVEIKFAGRLPPSFDATIRVKNAFAENRRLPVMVRAGSQELAFTPSTEPFETTLSFRGVGDTDTLVLTIPNPQSPRELGMSDDPRKLGIALETIALRAAR